MIVKVQLSISSSDAARRVLIYNKERDWYYEDVIEENDPLIRLMGGQLKKFFHALPVKNRKSKTELNKRGQRKQQYTIRIDAEAPWQEW